MDDRTVTLRGVIFDMGGTLLHFHPPGGGWRDMEELGASGWHAYLAGQGYALPGEATVRQVVWEQISSAWHDLSQGRITDMADMALGRQLSKAADRLGVRLTPDHAAEAEGAFVAGVQSVVRPIPGGQETLRALRARGLRLALVSNTMWRSGHHRADLERFGLLEPFEALLFSSDERVWKPAPEIFLRAVRALNLLPEQVAYVGDSLVMDVLGAQRAGLRGVWVENDDPYVPEGVRVTPDATIKRLADLVPIVDAWRNHASREPLL